MLKTPSGFFKKYVIDALSFMALGLFSSLILGLIIAQFSRIEMLSFLQPVADMLSAKSPVVGAAIGVAIAYGLGVAPLVLFASAVVGALGYHYGGPVGSYVAVVVGAALGNLISKKTPVDIILTPMLTIIAGFLIALLVGPLLNSLMLSLGALVNKATELNPFWMGIVVSVLVGMVLTLPISSAALCIMLNLDGLAAGAATIGCCAQMIGFAVISFKDNGIGGLLSQGLGTSMLQIGNIFKKPIIWVAPTLAAAILGPLSTMVFKISGNALGAGMGTSGLVGPIATYSVMTESPGADTWIVVGEIVLLYFLLPALLSLLIHAFLRKKKWIADGDMKI